MTDKRAVFSKGKDDWETPKWIKDMIVAEFGEYFDPCPNNWNPEFDKSGLSIPWEGVVFVNPPYSQIDKWAAMACQESQAHYNECVIMLIPSRTETKYWHNYIMNATEIRFFNKRVKFVGGKHTAPFPSSLVIFNKKYAPKMGIVNVPEKQDA